MWLKSCVARNGDPCLKPRSFSQPQIFFQKFCFHEIRLTDKMLYCTKIHNFSLRSLRDIHVYFWMRRFFLDVSIHVSATMNGHVI